MLNADELESKVRGEFVDGFPTIFRSQLLLAGYTQEQLLNMSSIIEYIGNIEELPELKKDIEEGSKEAESEAKRKAAEAINVEAIVKEAVLAAGYSTQDAKESFTRKEPTFVEPNLTKPVDIQDANYSIVEDQPESYGAIDRVLNWWRINKKRKHAEYVHSSGTLLKINEFGDSTIHSIGNSKIVVEKDSSEHIAGNKDYIISKGLYEHIVKDVVRRINGQYTVKVDGNITVKGSNIYLN